MVCRHHLARLRTDPTEAAELWAELAMHLTGSSGGASEIQVTNPQPGLNINLAVAEVRMAIREELVYLTGYIAEHRDIALPLKVSPWELIKLPEGEQGPLNRTRKLTHAIDDSTSRLGHFVATHADWIAKQPIAAEASANLQDFVSRARTLRQASNVRIVKIGQCPQTSDKRRCDGTLRGLLRPGDSLLPSAVTCDTNDNHSWDSTQWMKLGRAMKKAA